MAGIRAVAPLFSSSRSHAMPGADTGYAAARYTEVHHMEKEYKTWEVSADARVVRCLVLIWCLLLPAILRGAT